MSHNYIKVQSMNEINNLVNFNSSFSLKIENAMHLKPEAFHVIDDKYCLVLYCNI